MFIANGNGLLSDFVLLSLLVTRTRLSWVQLNEYFGVIVIDNASVVMLKLEFERQWMNETHSTPKNIDDTFWLRECVGD